MQTLIQDLRYAARMMHRNPGFSVLAILALGLGIGANTAVFTVVHGVLLRPLPFPQAGRLFLISHAPQGGPFGPAPGLSEEEYLRFARSNRSFEGIASFYGHPVSLAGAGEATLLRGAAVTADFLKILGTSPAIGRSFLASDERNPVALIGDRLWRSRFAADPQIAGRILRLDGVDHTVIGVMPPGMTFPYDAEVWMPFEVRVTPGNSFLRPVAGRLKPAVTPQAALGEVESILRAPGAVASVLPLNELLVNRIRDSLLIFAGAVAFVLLIACANVANLLLMRAASRRQEVAVRAAMGAGRWRLMRQFLTESSLISLAGGAAGTVFALWGVPALLAVAPAGRIPRLPDIRMDAPVLLFALVISLATGLLFGLAPAVYATRNHLRQSLARTAQGGFRNVLVAAEIALAIVLLTGAGLLTKSFLRLQAVDPGFRAENVLTMTLNLPRAVYRDAPALQNFHTRVLARLSAAPGVTAAGAVNWRPMGGIGIRGDLKIENGQTPRGYRVEKQVISEGYFRALGIRLLSGREFNARDLTGAPGAIVVGQRVAKTLWPGEDPLGKRITLEDRPKPQDWLTVVGVVDDIRQRDPRTPPGQTIYIPYTQTAIAGWLSRMTFAVRTPADPAGITSSMRAALREVDSDQPIETLATMQELVARTTAEPLFQARLLAVFSLLALLLAAIGVYGVLAHSVAARTHEIGIRMALGAERSDVLRMVLSRTVSVTLAGIAAGAAGALAATRVLTGLLFEVKPNDASTFLGVALVLMIVSLAAGWIPALRASRVDPLVALRYE